MLLFSLEPSLDILCLLLERKMQSTYKLLYTVFKGVSLYFRAEKMKQR